MNAKVVSLVAVGCVAGVTALLMLSSGRNNASNTQPDRSAPASAAVVTAVEREPRTAVNSHNPASDRILEIREKARQTEAKRRAAWEASQSEDTTAAMAAENEVMAMEQSLQESLTSLTEQLHRQPELTTNAIALLGEETDPATMMIIAQAIGESAEALGDKFPYDLLLDMALKDENLARREAALLALGYMTHIPSDLEQKVSEITQTAPTTELRVAGVNTMGSWMNRNRDLTQRISEKLLETRAANDEVMVRAMVLQTIGNMDEPLQGKVLEAMSEAVILEEDPWARSLAAVALGSGTGPQNRDAVLSSLENAYLNEQTLDTQRHIITQIVKASRYNAEQYLQRLPTSAHPQLAQDVADYVEILSSMDRNDWGAIWTRKSELDHQRGTYPGGHGGHGSDDE